MFYNYVLQSQKDGNYYVGFTEDLQGRLNEHNNCGKNSLLRNNPT